MVFPVGRLEGRFANLVWDVGGQLESASVARSVVTVIERRPAVATDGRVTGRASLREDGSTFVTDHRTVAGGNGSRLSLGHPDITSLEPSIHTFSDSNLHAPESTFASFTTTGFLRVGREHLLMTLDPVHFDGIARLARRIDPGTDERDRRAFAETVWEEFLDPLLDDGRRVLEPVDEQARRLVDCEAVALRDREFPTEHGLDAGTINPTTFKNGLVIDIAQAAMSATPSDLDLHRSRTTVMTVHSNDETMTVDETWGTFDGGYSRSRAVKIPPLPRFAEGVVHALALYLAESTHARDHADTVSDLLVLDGPLYPRGLLRWADQHPDLADFLLDDPRPTTVLENYVRLVETFVDRDVPLVGFVKNPATRVVTRALKDDRGIDVSVPWADDSALFTRLLERGEFVDDVDGERWERDTSALTYTNWFLSRGGVDRPLSAEGDALGVDRRLERSAYEVTFFVVYDPRDDLLYRIEAPYAFTKDPETRERLTMQLLQDVAVAHGPPTIVEKADELARISNAEKASLRETLETQFDTVQDRTYDDHRWDEQPY